MHMMDEQTKMNHFPLVDWTCQPPPVVVAVVALPEWQGAPSSPAGEEVKREDKDRLDEEGAVQAGLVKWSGGLGLQPPTWQVLLEAMTFARIAQQHVQGLKETLGTQGTLFTL